MPERCARACATSIALAVGVAVVAGCGGGPAAAIRTSDRGMAAPAGLVARIEVQRAAGRPGLATVTREGDPGGAMAALLLVDEATDAPLLAALLEERLRDAGRPAEARVARGAVMLAWDVDAEGTAAALVQVRTLLEAPVAPMTADAASALQRRAAELGGAPAPAGLEVAARCAGAPAPPERRAPPGEPAATIAVGELERSRAAAVSAARTTLAVVGSEALVERTVDALAGGEAWAGGSALPPRPVAESHSMFAREPTRGARSPDLVIAIDLPRATAAPTLARVLAERDAPLATQLRLLPPGLEIAGATGVARPGGEGSCLRVDLRATRGDALGASGAAQAAAVLRRMASAPAGPAEGEIAARSILEAGDARDAALRAAWWATTGDAASPAVRSSLALAAAPGQEDAARAELARHAVHGGAGAPALERRTRVEPGQGTFHLLLGSPCASALASEAGSAELAVALVAAARGGRRDVELEPFIDRGSAGIVARAVLLPGETPTALAERVATAAVLALGGPPPSAADLFDARVELVGHASQRGGHPEGAQALARGLAPERPADIWPLGLEIELVRADASRSAGRLAELLRGPIRAAVVANVDAAQAEAALARIERHLPPSAGTTCPAAARASSAPAPRADVRIAGDEPFAQISLGVRTLSSPAAADMAVALLAAPDGALARAAAAVGASFRVEHLGEAGVLLDVRAAPERIDDAIAAITGALAAIARGEITEPGARAARLAAEADARARLASPQGRLRATWSGLTFERRPTVADPRSAAAELAPARWTMVVARPG